MSPPGWVPPGVLLGVALTLFLAQVFHAGWYRATRRHYVAVLVLTAAGMLAGQGWDALGLPAVHLGQVNLLPAVAFAAALQPLVPRLSLRLP